jgi:hypothetical protein
MIRDIKFSNSSQDHEKFILHQQSKQKTSHIVDTNTNNSQRELASLNLRSLQVSIRNLFSADNSSSRSVGHSNNVHSTPPTCNTKASNSGQKIRGVVSKLFKVKERKEIASPKSEEELHCPVLSIDRQKLGALTSLNRSGAVQVVGEAADSKRDAIKTRCTHR